MDRSGDPSSTGGFHIGSEGDEEAAAGPPARVNVVAFDPVVDDVRGDLEHRGDLCDGELVGALGFGCVRLVDVTRSSCPLGAGGFDVRPEGNAPLVVEAAPGSQPSSGDPVDGRAVADADPAGNLSDAELAGLEQLRAGDAVGRGSDATRPPRRSRRAALRLSCSPRR